MLVIVFQSFAASFSIWFSDPSDSCLNFHI